MARSLPQRALGVARRLAVAAGDLLMRGLGGRRAIAHKPGAGNLVTDMDRASEDLILRGLRREFPDHAILAEESGASPGSRGAGAAAEYLWYVDPLDGTMNYAHGLPIFCVSIAFGTRDSIESGVVYCPPWREMYEAVRGRGARRNGRPIRASSEARLDRALLVTGFSYVPELKRANLKLWEAFIRRAQGVRRIGSAALDLCFTAAGSFDGFWEYHLAPWDLAAGALIAHEAGAHVTDLNGGPVDFVAGNVLAAGPRLHASMLRVIRSTCPERRMAGGST